LDIKNLGPSHECVQDKDDLEPENHGDSQLIKVYVENGRR